MGPLRLDDLPGWEDEDHAAALAAFQAGCRVTADAALYAVCQQARTLGALGETDARAFFEANFEAQPVAGEGILTGYFAPEYEAEDLPIPPFTAAVRPRPADLPPPGGPRYPDRATIEADPPDQALAWMRPEDLFFMQIQGSGVLDFPDGHRMRASFAGSNGWPFTPIAVPLRARGALSARGSSAEAIGAWLADHRGAEADAVMQLDPRYVFFRLAPDDGAEPAGSAGLPLTPGRSIAVDASQHPMGGLYWIDADAPTLNGAALAYRRLAVALDTGGAIIGPVRADLYFGRGPVAGAQAGHVRHALRLYQLTPVSQAER
jgi:membrane-bound lytic murein transglycosylase A